VLRRAIHPSTKSRTSATVARATSVATDTSRTNEAATSAATQAESTARTSVTHVAGPSRRTARSVPAYATIRTELLWTP
jgi:hypothetical protein